MDKIEIKIAKTSDATHIALLGRITFKETFSHLFRDKNDLLNYFNKTFSVEKIKTGITNQNNIFWIALVDGLPVGYAKLKLKSQSEFISGENVCQLQKIYILNDFLSMKIGLELQDKLIIKAVEKGYDKIWLSVLESNERAINFCKKNGFETIGTHDYQIGKENFHFFAMSRRL